MDEHIFNEPLVIDKKINRKVDSECDGYVVATSGPVSYDAAIRLAGGFGRL